MPEILTLDGIEAKREGTYGTDSTPATSDGVRIAQRMWSRLLPDYQWENDRREVASGSIIPIKAALPRGRWAKMEIFAEVKGAGSDIPPEVAELLVACGLPETDGTALWTYGPLTSGTKGSCTIYAYTGAMLYKVVGCRGRVEWPMVVGEVLVFHFTMWGIMVTDPADSALAGITYDATEPIAGVNTALTVGGVTLDWLSGSLDLIGVDAQMLPSGNATDGISSFDFGDADPTFKLTYRKIAIATYNPWADRKARTSRTLVMSWGPAVAFNRLKVLGATVSVMAHPPSDSQGFANVDVTYRVESGGVFQFD